VISGSGILIKDTSTSSLTLSGPNTYTGGTTISAGTLALGSAAGAGTGTITANSSYGASYASGGAPFLKTTVTGLTVANNIALSSTAGYYALQMGAAAGGTVTWSGNISGGGVGVVLQIDTPNSGDSTSNTTLSGTNTLTGQIRLNRGTLTLANASAAGTADLFLQTNANPAGNLIFSNSFTLSNNVIFGTTANDIISTGANNVVLSGVISGASAWGKAGSGTLALTNTNTYTGTTAVAAGALEIGGAGSLGSGTYAAAISNAGTFIYNSTAAQTLSGTVSGAGALTKKAASTLTLTSNFNSYTGATNVEAGTLVVGGSLSGSAVAVSNGATLAGTADNTSGGGFITGSVSVASGGTLFAGNGNDVTDSGLSIDGAVTLNSNSRIQLTLGAAGLHSTLQRFGGTWSFLDANQAFLFVDSGAQTNMPYVGIITGLEADPFGGNASTWTILNPGWAGVFTYDSGNINLTLSQVPEPGAAASLLGGMALLLGWHRRRRNP
jgi:autotransporter-associated beta strand protein